MYDQCTVHLHTWEHMPTQTDTVTPASDFDEKSRSTAHRKSYKIRVMFNELCRQLLKDLED